MLKLVEDDTYYYDAKKGERPIKFIEGLLCHFEGDFAGKPFLLCPYQQQLVRDLFGWHRISDHRRRFRELYLEIAKGNGKSPLLSAIGIYMLVAEGVQGAHIISVATDFQQANITFDTAKKMIEASPRLAALCQIKQYEIIVKATNSKWTIVSGTAEGKHGFKPTCVLADEAHEWSNRKLYDNITSNLFKRPNTLMLVATNAGSSKETICWWLHERAQRVLDGKSKDDTLYPVIYTAPKDCKLDDLDALAKANPGLGHIITVDNLKPEIVKAKENAAQEAKYRRLHLSQWIQGADKWLDMNAWDACTHSFKTEEVAQLPCYLGLDLSESDDLSALAMLWVKDDHTIYAKTKHWLPKQTAYRYEDKDAIPFTEWAGEKHITLLDSTTIDPEAQLRIARFITKLTKKYNVQRVCYDKYRASLTIATLEREGITCEPISQKGWELSPACLELERRLKDGSIVIKPDPCLRWQASNVEVKVGDRGDLRPVKEAASGTYKGRRSQKIDGIQALLTALTRAMKHGMQENTGQWTGEIVFI